MRISLEPRLSVPPWVNLAVPAGASVAGLLMGGILMGVLGVDPVRAYWEMFRGALGSGYGFSEVIVKTIPLTLAGLATLISFRMLLWNIGAEGQLALGALATVAVVRFAFVDSFPVMLLLMSLAAILAGGAWGAIAGFLKARWNVNEIITTLMLNYIALLLMDYFLYGPWKDPTSLGFPMTAAFPDAARLPAYFGTRVHLGIVFALALALIMRAILRWTQWGFEIRVIGENPKAARYAGMNIGRNIMLVLFVSGAIAGLAGMGEVAGLQGRLARGFSTGIGFAGILVSWLARLNPLGVPVVALGLGILLVGGDSLQITMGLPLASIQVLEGLILFALLAGETLCRYRVRISRGDEKKEERARWIS
jgi:simple sugar transport system permease protein